MRKKKDSMDRLLSALQERTKELNCLYQVEEILSASDAPLEEICPKIIRAIPPGWQFSDICEARITVDDAIYQSQGFAKSPWVQSADIIVQDIVVGTVNIYYTKKMPLSDHGPFLKEEAKLIRTIADRLGNFILHQRMKDVVEGWENARRGITDSKEGEWKVVLEMVKQTDRDLYLKIARKMLNHLCWKGIKDAEELLQSASSTLARHEAECDTDDWNVPHKKDSLAYSADFCSASFKIAETHFSDSEILELIQKWIQEDRISFLGQVVNRNLSLAEVADAIRRYHYLAQEGDGLLSPSKIGIVVSLIRRFLGDQLQFINVAKNYIEINDFYHLLRNLIYSAESHGKLGGKGAGLYLAAQILKKQSRENNLLADVKIPKTWYITSDVVLHFMHYNNFDEVIEQKYKEINQVRLEYPHIVQSFKNGHYPADIISGLSVALDDFGETPLIVRSSSLLEDRLGAAFSGKYKSLFIANQGSKRQRLEALMDAIAEVYASVFGPDPIEYRAERGLIDFGEEMGILIQQVVGTRVGKYYLPSYAGVAFSNNEFRWSPRIDREDGLIRMVPGLGTRAVDRLSDDYPMLVAPGQPGLRVNVTMDEVARYSPNKIDVINLETNSFETHDLVGFLEEVGYDYPALRQIVSVMKDDHIARMSGIDLDMNDGRPVATFESLISSTPFVERLGAILKTLQETLETPVDIEFASDGKDFYLLQCRPQSYSREARPAPIPRDTPDDRVIFSANRYVSNGLIPEITHIVYVDPKQYGALSERRDLVAVGRAVSRLNKLLPKRQFILMGPGRWGSRGDIKLGVNVTYSDINNTAALIEIAFKKGSYLPDLSFGTHFFQDLVEANIRYLPLYPDDEGILFNEPFLTRSRNLLAEVAPEFEALSDTVRLVDVPSASDGKVLRILMNADLDEAVAILADPGGAADIMDEPVEADLPKQEKYWRWRIQMAERIAAQLDPDRYGVAGFYVFGSTKNASAGPGSDIDILVHFGGSPAQRKELELWLEGWSLCLAEMNFMRTGYRSQGLLDVHFITDEDIARKSSYATKIGAVTDPARPLPLMKK